MSEEIKNEELKEEKAIEIKRPGFIQNVADLHSVANTMIQSGLFKDITAMQQAAVKILAGQEFGIGPFAAMKSIHIIQGSPTLAAGLMASKVKAHPRYDYRIKTIDDKGCIVQFYEIVNGKREHIGDSKFDEADALQAGLMGKDNWKKYPRNMYFSRAISNGVRFFCPDVFYGMSVYTPEEIDPDWVDVDAVTVDAGDMNKTTAPTPPAKSSVRPLSPDKLAEMLAMKADIHRKGGHKADENARKKLIANLNTLVQGDDNLRHELTEYLCGQQSTKDLDDGNILALNDWMGAYQADTGEWMLDAMAWKEYKRIVEEVFGNGSGK